MRILSARDREFIADLYGQPLQKAKISGTIEIDGIDRDAFSALTTQDQNYKIGVRNGYC